MKVAITEHIDPNPYADRSPEDVEKALRKMGLKRITEYEYIRRENRRQKLNVRAI